MRVAVLTSSRADFGIYLPLLKALQNDSSFALDIIAFGTHLSPFHGYTLSEIEDQGFFVRYKIESLLVSDSKESIATAMSLTMMKFAAFWQEHQSEFDLVFCLGDRYEMFAAVMAAVPFQVKFAHIHGGEKTLGAIDNIFRHSISHAATIHFTATDQYKERVKLMVDSDTHIYNTGALSLDSLSNVPFLSIQEFKAKWDIDLSIPTILTTFHPETVNANLNESHIEELIKVIHLKEEYQFLITMPNSDTTGNILRRILKEKLAKYRYVHLVENLGTQSYFTAMKHCCFLLGNTSSGIIEAASFGKFVINLGNRQEGRVYGPNVIQTAITKKAILLAIANIERNSEYVGDNIYFKSGSAEAIIKYLKNIHE